MVRDLPAEFGLLQERLDGAEVRILGPVSAVRNPGREKTK